MTNEKWRKTGDLLPRDHKGEPKLKDGDLLKNDGSEMWGVMLAVGFTVLGENTLYVNHEALFEYLENRRMSLDDFLNDIKELISLSDG